MKVLIVIAAAVAWIAVATGAILLIILSWLSVAHAADNDRSVACASHATIIKMFDDMFHETQSATALTSAGTLLEVLTASDGSTWTIIVSRPDGLSCVVAAGQNWQDKVNQMPPKGNDL